MLRRGFMAHIGYALKRGPKRFAASCGVFVEENVRNLTGIACEVFE